MKWDLNSTTPTGLLRGEDAPITYMNLLGMALGARPKTWAIMMATKTFPIVFEGDPWLRFPLGQKLFCLF